jgi:hypothetical protein
MGKAGGKRKVYYTQSTGKMGDSGAPAVEVKVKSGWNPGKARKA